MRTLFFPLILAALLASARASDPHEVAVEAVCSPATGDREFLSYRLIQPANVRENDADHARARQHVRTALSGRGLFEALPGTVPDLVIQVDCGLGAPRGVIRTHLVPVRPENPNPFLNSEPMTLVAVNERVYLAPKFLLLTARAGGSPQQLWRVWASVSDEAVDLEPALPVLAAAAMNAIGSNTGGVTLLRLQPKDVDILFIEAGMKVAGR